MKSNAGGFVASTKSRTQSSKEKEFRRRRDVHLEDASSLVDSHKSTEAKSGLLASSAIHKPIKMWPKTVRWADDSGKDLHSFKEIPGRTSLKMNSKKAKEADAHLHGHHQDEVDDFGMGCIEAIMAIENYIQGQSSSCSKEEVKKIETRNQRKCSSDEENISPVKSSWMPRLNSIEIDQHLPEDNSSDMEMASTDEEEFIDPNDLDYDALLQSRGYCIPGEHGASRCVPSPVECSRDVNEIKEEVIMESSQASTSDASINGLMNLNALYNEATVDSIPVDISSIPYPDPIAAQDDLIGKVIANLAMAGSAPVVYNGGLEFGYTEVNPKADAHIHGQCQNEADDFEKGCIEAVMAIESFIQGKSSSCSKEEAEKIESVNKRKCSLDEENISPVKSGWMPPLNSFAAEEDNSSDMEMASSDGEGFIDQNDLLDYDAPLESKGYSLSGESEVIRCDPSTVECSRDENKIKKEEIMESSLASTSDESNLNALCNDATVDSIPVDISSIPYPDPPTVQDNSIMKIIANFALAGSAPYLRMTFQMFVFLAWIVPGLSFSDGDNLPTSTPCSPVSTTLKVPDFIPSFLRGWTYVVLAVLVCSLFIPYGYKIYCNCKRNRDFFTHSNNFAYGTAFSSFLCFFLAGILHVFEEQWYSLHFEFSGHAAAFMTQIIVLVPIWYKGHHRKPLLVPSTIAIVLVLVAGTCCLISTAIDSVDAKHYLNLASYLFSVSAAMMAILIAIDEEYLVAKKRYEDILREIREGVNLPLPTV